MCNTNLLKSEITKKGFKSQKSFCEVAGLRSNTFNAKLNNKGYFDTEEIKAIAKALGLVTDEGSDYGLLCQIFLA